MSLLIQVFLIIGLIAIVGYGLFSSHPLPQPQQEERSTFDLEAYRNSEEFKRKHGASVERDAPAPPPPAALAALKPAAEARAPEEPPAYDPPEIEGDTARVEAVIAALRVVEDPELGIDIYNLGLIRRLIVTPEGGVEIDLIFTAVFCPFSARMVQQIKEALAGLPWATDLAVEVKPKIRWRLSHLTPQGRVQFEEVMGW